MKSDQNLKFEDVPAILAHLVHEFSSLKESLSQPTFKEIEPPVDIDEARGFIKSENVQTIYRMVRERRIPFHKKGARLFFYKSELNSWIKSEKQNSLTP